MKSEPFQTVAGRWPVATPLPDLRRRRSPIRGLRLVALITFFLPPGGKGLTAATIGKSADAPNVVLILIDDLSHYGVTAYGANQVGSMRGRFEPQEIETPNLDALARSGLRCDHAYAYPLCENTRVALMSGKGNQRNYLKPKSLHESDITFGDVFQRAGFSTGLFGKWKQTRGTRSSPGKTYISKFGWDEYVAFDVVTEGQRFINPNLVVNGQIQNYTGRKDLDPETGRRWYGPDIANRAACEFIRNHATASDKPFLLYYPMMLVHDEHKPTPDTKPASRFDEFDEATDNKDGHKGDDHRYFPDMIRYMDKLIGKVVDQLDDAGLREQTLIVVVGDNGTKETFSHVFPDGSVYPARKGGNADNGIHVPLILSQPGTIPDGKGEEYRSYDGLVYITDIFPTIADAAGVEIPNRNDLDGISFWEQAKGASGEPRETIHSWFIGNYTYDQEEHVVEFAFDKNFKRYAPSPAFPNGRFFDLRTDRLERVGDRFERFKFGVLQFSGLDIRSLAPEQREAYDRLGKVLDQNAIKPLKKLTINAGSKMMSAGGTQTLAVELTPPDATRNGVIYESSDPSVVMVNKFGEVTAIAAGSATVSVYSWSDANPLADNSTVEYRKTEVHDQVDITVN